MTGDHEKTKAQLIRELTELRQRLVDSKATSFEARYLDMYDNAPDMFASVEAATGKIRDCNQTLANKLGYSKTEIIGQPIFDIYHPDCMEGVKKAFHSFVTTGEVHNAELQLKRKDGSKIDVCLNVSSVRDENGKVLYSRSIWRDISEQKQAEEVLKEEKAFSNSIINTAQAIILLLNQDATIRFMNPYTEKLTGYKLAEVEGKDWFEIFLPKEDQAQIHELFKSAISGVPTAGNINMILTKDGEECFIKWHDSVLKDTGGQIKCLLAIGQDITEQKQAEDELITKLDELKLLNSYMVKTIVKIDALKKEVKRLKDEIATLRSP